MGNHIKLISIKHPPIAVICDARHHINVERIAEWSVVFNKMVVNFKVFKKSSPNGKLIMYLGKRDFVDHISGVEPVGTYLEAFSTA